MKVGSAITARVRFTHDGQWSCAILRLSLEEMKSIKPKLGKPKGK